MKANKNKIGEMWSELFYRYTSNTTDEFGDPISNVGEYLTKFPISSEIKVLLEKMESIFEITIEDKRKWYLEWIDSGLPDSLMVEKELDEETNG